MEAAEAEREKKEADLVVKGKEETITTPTSAGETMFKPLQKQINPLIFRVNLQSNQRMTRTIKVIGLTSFQRLQRAVQCLTRAQRVRITEYPIRTLCLEVQRDLTTLLPRARAEQLS